MKNVTAGIPGHSFKNTGSPLFLSRHKNNCLSKGNSGLPERFAYYLHIKK